MRIRNTKEPLLLFLGDVAFFYISLWLTLLVRFRAIPTANEWDAHFMPFTILFGIWVVVYYIAGLYGKHTLILKSKLPNTILNVALVNSALAIAFFYLTPFFSIEPRLSLFIYLAISFIAILLWRIKGHNLLGLRPRYRAILIGSGDEMNELKRELVHNKRYNLNVVSSVDVAEIDSLDPQRDIIQPIYSEGIGVVIISMHHKKIIPILPHLYNLMFARVRFIDMHKVYEDLFDRIPLSLLRHSWFLENISLAPHVLYTIFKRAADFLVALLLFFPSLFVYPFVWLAIKLDDDGPLFFIQERVGQNNRAIRIVKFRTMRSAPNEDELFMADNASRVTRVGAFLRKSRIDELPQLWNVLKGDLSLVGPRPEFPEAVEHYEEEISYYGVRHLVKPGLSGWAQIYHQKHPHHALDVEETRNKLSYDLYYLKNRSLMLDVKIMLRTVKILLSGLGS